MLLKRGLTQLALIRAAMISLLAYFAMEIGGRLYHAPAGFWDGLYDGVRGCAFGVALGCVIVAAMKARTATT